MKWFILRWHDVILDDMLSSSTTWFGHGRYDMPADDISVPRWYDVFKTLMAWRIRWWLYVFIDDMIRSWRTWCVARYHDIFIDDRMCSEHWEHAAFMDEVMCSQLQCRKIACWLRGLYSVSSDLMMCYGYLSLTWWFERSFLAVVTARLKDWNAI